MGEVILAIISAVITIAEAVEKQNKENDNA